jgi:hypothetical protein
VADASDASGPDALESGLGLPAGSEMGVVLAQSSGCLVPLYPLIAFFHAVRAEALAGRAGMFISDSTALLAASGLKPAGGTYELKPGPDVIE